MVWLSSPELFIRMYIIVWEFLVRAECAAEFEEVYGPQGQWASLFAQGEGYRGTRLLRDTADPLRYVTFDLWSSRQALDSFRRQHQQEYQALDARCERLTSSEKRLG
ncbi:MAG TPA: antibiotic biosynthesis monooxygenase family protein, partial [Terriglobales bacterium]|nr:antibiotic biosynthesis monooxygenase family protein [Terriglobales bacterium]